ncbi:MAG: hypothetical protein FWD76_02685 [Firmicutes bacterium]|nr:hypothetical protein [Bacillota bacterium]
MWLVLRIFVPFAGTFGMRAKMCQGMFSAGRQQSMHRLTLSKIAFFESFMP